MAPLVLHVSLLKFNFSNIIAGHVKSGPGRLLFASKNWSRQGTFCYQKWSGVLAAKSVETAYCLYCMETMTRRHITNLVPGVGPGPLLVGKSGLV